jgi:pimeloyl-ACP methyl ester carboxylesterase
MTATLVCLHGFTQNGAQLRAQLAKLTDRLAQTITVVTPDAPHACAQTSVDRLYAAWRSPRPAPPYLCWWDASDDGRVYRGWETSYERLSELCRAHERVVLLGFSQGAMLAAGLAALSCVGEFPALRAVVLVAGRKPRSERLRPLFDVPVRVPSLHVWGERDALAGDASASLADAFDAQTRAVAVWPGPHAVPSQGPAADAILEFVARHAGD